MGAARRADLEQAQAESFESYRRAFAANERCPCVAHARALIKAIEHFETMMKRESK